jgi:hypothetical protein
MKKGLRDDEVGMSEALPLIPERPHKFLHNSGAPTVVSIEISHNNADGGWRDVQLLGGQPR